MVFITLMVLDGRFQLILYRAVILIQANGALSSSQVTLSYETCEVSTFYTSGISIIFGTDANHRVVVHHQVYPVYHAMQVKYHQKVPYVVHVVLVHIHWVMLLNAQNVKVTYDDLSSIVFTSNKCSMFVPL
jgi:hypothetical protein